MLYLTGEYAPLKVRSLGEERLPFSFVRWSPVKAEDESLFLSSWTWRLEEGATREIDKFCGALQWESG